MRNVQQKLSVARGEQPAELFFKNATSSPVSAMSLIVCRNPPVTKGRAGRKENQRATVPRHGVHHP